LSKKFTIIIFTGRRSVLQKIEIEDKLKTWGVPFDEVMIGKPQACFMIDDRAVHHKSWRLTLEEISNRMR